MTTKVKTLKELEVKLRSLQSELLDNGLASVLVVASITPTVLCEETQKEMKSLGFMVADEAEASDAERLETQNMLLGGLNWLYNHFEMGTPSQGDE